MRHRIPGRRAAVPSALLVVLAAAAPATAGTVRLEQRTLCVRTVPCVATLSLRFTATPGERNDVTLDPGGTVLVDRGAPPVAGEGCAQLDRDTVRCDGARNVGLLELGDGDDRADTSGGTAIVRGEAGADELTGSTLEGGDGDDALRCAGARCSVSGGRGADVLTGNDGADALRGDEGPDVVIGGAGDDSLSGGEGPDRLDGGAGHDQVSYGGTGAPMRIDLAAGTAGEDLLTGIESATGGDGPDVMIGTAGADHLAGGAGDDLLVGGGGDDVLDGGLGADTLDGGDGRDQLNAGPAGPGRIFGGAGDDRIVFDRAFTSGGPEPAGAHVGCGAGRDTVLGPSAADVLGASCEGAGLTRIGDSGSEGTVIAPDRRLTRTATGLALRITCAACPKDLPVHDVALLDRRGVALANATLTPAAARRGRLVLAVPRAQRRRLPATARLRLQSGGSKPPRIVFAVRIDRLPAARG